MIKGGYKIVDFEGNSLSDTAVTMNGMYAQIVDDYNKPIMVSGVILSGELQDDAYVSVKVGDGYVELTVYGGVITVTEDDEVSFAQADSNVKLTEDVAQLMSKALMKTSNTTLTSDVNDATTGWAYYGSGSANAPGSGTYFILTLIHTPYKCQLSINKSTGTVQVRVFAETWTQWKTIAFTS